LPLHLKQLEMGHFLSQVIQQNHLRQLRLIGEVRSELT